MSRTIQEISAEADIIYRKIANLAPGDCITYEEMSAAIGRDVTKNRGVISTARKKALRDDGIVLVTVRGSGYQRAQGDDYSDIAAAAMRRSSRAAKKGLKESLAMPLDEYKELDEEKRRAVDTRRTILGLQALAAKASSQKKIAQKCQNGRLPEAMALEALK